MGNVVLIGYQGTGKTYYGKKLASELDMDFVDTDVEMQKEWGLKYTVREIQAHLGERGFREKEKDILLSLEGKKNTVIATGGGVVEIKDIGYILRGLGRVLYLYNELEVLRKRWKGIGNFYQGMTIEEMFKRRDEMYRACCNKKVEGVWDQILLAGSLR